MYQKEKKKYTQNSKHLIFLQCWNLLSLSREISHMYLNFPIFFSLTLKWNVNNTVDDEFPPDFDESKPQESESAVSIMWYYYIMFSFLPNRQHMQGSTYPPARIDSTCRAPHIPLPDGPGQVKLPGGQVDVGKFFLQIIYNARLQYLQCISNGDTAVLH